MLELDIVLFSPIRTGSTLVYNILRELYPQKRIIKLHQHVSTLTENHKIIITYRNPIASYVSHLLLHMTPDKINCDTINEYLSEYQTNGWNDLFIVNKPNNFLLLKYEEFYNDYDNIFDKIEKYMDILIDEDFRDFLKKKYSRKSVKEFQSQYSGFSQYDKITHIHGNHISQYNGETEYYKEILDEKTLKYLEKILKKYIDLYNQL